MRLIIGGTHQGKLDWYLRTSGRSMQQVADGETLPLELLPDRPVLNHLHRWVYRMVQQGKDVQAAMERYLQRFLMRSFCATRSAAAWCPSTLSNGSGGRKPAGCAACWRRGRSGWSGSSAASR